MNNNLKLYLNNNFSAIIRGRGKKYFNIGAVKNVQISNNFVSAKIKGSKNYSTVITFSENIEPHSMSCSCPYFEVENCKHLAALLYYLDDVGFESTAPKVSIKENMQIVFPFAKQNMNKEQTKEDLEKRKLAKLIEKFAPIIEDNKREVKATNKSEQKNGYAISHTGFRTFIYPIRINTKKNGSIGAISRIHTMSYNSFDKVNFSERLVLDYLCDYKNSPIYIGNTVQSRNSINQREMYNDILNFLNEKEVFIENKYETYQTVEVLSETAICKLVITENLLELILELNIVVNGQEFIKREDISIIIDNPLWIFCDNKIFKIDNMSFERFEYFKGNSFKLTFPKDYLDVFEKEFLPKIASKLPIISDKYNVENVHLTPTKKLFLKEQESDLLLKIKFGYQEIDFDYDPKEMFTTIYNNEKILTIHRDKEFENNAIEEIKALYVKNIGVGTFTPRKDPLDFIFQNFTYLKEIGFEIFGEEDLKKFKINISKPKVSFNVSSGIDWFDVTTEVEYNGTAVPFSELVAAIKEKKKYFKLSDGSSGIIPTNWVNKFKQTLSIGKLNEEGVRFSKIQALALETILEEADDFVTDEHFKEHVEKLKSFDKIERQSIPRTFNGKLRNYQKTGVDWLYFLKEYSFGGILADDMGLGKTIQSIILLLKEKKENKNYTALIVAPTSVIFNWIDEIGKFAPSLTTLNHTGNEREKTDNATINKYDVVLTSYGILLRDYELLKDFQFHYIILDESQKIKNPISKTGRVVRKLKADYRLCLTGTPIENNLTELWSQMAFLNPGLLGSYQKFNDLFVKPISKDNSSETMNLLKRTIYPFVLRRTKDVVAKDLPEKTETIHFCEMEKAQAKVYNFWKNSIKLEILEEIKKKGIKKSGFKVMEGLLRLRQICNHPVLVQSDYKRESSKFEEFKLMLSKVVAEGHKVLVFSQFVKMLEIMREFLDKENIKYEYLTGSTQNREERVKNFKNNDDIKVFLISLKAGGFGLNLTEADYVFHYDPWWNPAVEMQATDRTHRIGQDKNVFVYKFITKDSVEEKILYLQEKKKQLVQEIISTDSSLLKNITQKDIEILFE
ncbi:MAG: DEAD/DEAH box helicase family protein [Bacteroidetes bacterium]|nr:DEAD/DEAH box helicase family protein [Bacteroidota bacterium]MBU1116541.1 DEAD/DEAH box helicase family protein [Bacteroidota bacterium]MBU1796839.1 DEAD/DEAH box helicase family protein [Bacteroidota bacterium]